MKPIYFVFFVFVCVALGLGFVVGRLVNREDPKSFSILPTPVPTPLAKYRIESMKGMRIESAEFTKGDVIKDSENFSTFGFDMRFDPTLTAEESKKKVTGVCNLPRGSGLPLVLMVRGYVDQKIYTPGTGTKNAAEYFAKNGFITVSLDFLGYADSDSESGNIFESRFQTYTSFLSLMSSVASPSFSQLTEGKWDGKNIFIWAHSNGGQIALTSLIVSGEVIPATFWAPVTKPFPYSVLYYTDESADQGEFIRKELSKFEAVYKAREYSFTNYLGDLKGPFQFQQGTGDDAVPYEWTRSFVKLLKSKEVDVTYFEYKGADHNLRPNWETAVEHDLEFFKKWSK